MITMTSTASSQTTASPVTLLGTIDDVVGHPVAGATIHLVLVNSSGQSDYNGTTRYLANGATVPFSTTDPFDSALTNAKGQFSFTLTDSHSGSDTYVVEYQPLTE